MARVGCTEYFYSGHDPKTREQYFREVLTRNYWDHPFHPQKYYGKTQVPDIKSACAESLDQQRRPWEILARTNVDDGMSTGAIPRARTTARLRPHLIASTPGAMPTEDSMDATSTLRNRPLHASTGSLRADSTRSSNASSGRLQGLLAPRQPMSFRPWETPLQPSGPTLSRQASSRGPDAKLHHRMPSFARIYNA
mmetsp:Transcript_95261/g.269248  ORF Transcript_95261/g.269248 Transcript_95261/m.269248 type:complete len:195 (-) Transcript_95261:64-648(-)